MPQNLLQILKLYLQVQYNILHRKEASLHKADLLHGQSRPAEIRPVLHPAHTAPQTSHLSV